MIKNQFDAEDIMDKIVSMLTDNTYGLNIHIGYINTDKASKDSAAGRSTITTPTLDYTNAILYFDDNEVSNQDPYIVIGIESHSAQGTLDNIVIKIIVVIADDGNPEYTKRKVIRFSNALKHTLKEFQYAGFSDSANMEILDIEPLTDEDETKYYYSGGIEISNIN